MEKVTATGTREWSRHKDVMRCCNVMVPKHPPFPSTPTVEGREPFPALSGGERGVVKGNGAESADRHGKELLLGEVTLPPSEPHTPQLCYMSSRGRCGPTLARSLTRRWWWWCLYGSLFPLLLPLVWCSSGAAENDREDSHKKREKNSRWKDIYKNVTKDNNESDKRI